MSTDKPTPESAEMARVRRQHAARATSPRYPIAVHLREKDAQSIVTGEPSIHACHCVADALAVAMLPAPAEPPPALVPGGEAAPTMAHRPGCGGVLCACPPMVVTGSVSTIVPAPVPGGEAALAPLDPGVLAAQAATAEGPRQQPRFRYVPAFYGLYFTAMAETARELGWALALHGSMARDLDVMAMPWTADAATPEALVARIVERHGLIPGADGWEAKPHGRRSHSLMMGGHFYVDLSVMPVVAAPVPGETGDDDWREALATIDEATGTAHPVLARQLREARATVSRLAADNARLTSEAKMRDAAVAHMRKMVGCGEREGLSEGIGRLAADNAALRARLDATTCTIGDCEEPAVACQKHLAAAYASGTADMDSAQRELGALRARLDAAERERCGEACENAVDARDQYAHALTDAAAAVGCEQEWSNLHDHGGCILNGIAALKQERDAALSQLSAASSRYARAVADADEVRARLVAERDAAIASLAVEAEVVEAFDDGLKAAEEGKTEHDNPWAFAGSEWRRASAWIAGRNLWAWKHERLAALADVARLKTERDAERAGYHALDDNWQTMHLMAMTPIRNAVGLPYGTVPEIVEAIREARGKALAEALLLESIAGFLDGYAVASEYRSEGRALAGRLRDVIAAKGGAQ